MRPRVAFSKSAQWKLDAIDTQSQLASGSPVLSALPASHLIPLSVRRPTLGSHIVVGFHSGARFHPRAIHRTRPDAGARTNIDKIELESWLLQQTD